VAVLRLMLLSIAVLPIIAASGCSNPPTGLVSTQQEIQIGQQAADQFEAQNPTRDDPLVDQIGARIVAVQPRKGLPWRFRVAQSNDVNAFALPGGYIYVYQGLLDAIHNDPDMLAAALAHESSHVIDRHGVKLMEQQTGIGALVELATNGRDRGALQQVLNVVGVVVTQGYSRNDEYQADHDGVIWMHRAGYDPQGMVRLLETLQRVAPNSGGGLTKYFEDHPGTPSRIQRVQQQIARGDIG
jgi:beta-barrel assembly-enhancing protease